MAFTAKDGLNEMILDAQTKQQAGDLQGALTGYEKALRIVTPDDFELERAMAIKGPGVVMTSTSRAADQIDSDLRS